MKIIVVHGRGLKPTKACKLGYVREVLTESVRRVSPTSGAWLAKHPRTVELAYYADLFQHLGDEPCEPCESFREPIDRLYQESRSCPLWMRFRGAMNDMGIDAAILLSRFLDPSVRQRAVQEQFRDTVAYFQRPFFAARIRRRLLDRLIPALRRRQPIVLIAHSFGSVVAYDVLWRLSHASEHRRLHDRRLVHFITIGSPLGDRFIKSLLAGWRHPLRQRYPTNLTRWDNIAARGDMICHDARISDDFREMHRLKPPIAVRDYPNCCVVYRGREEQWNPHKLYGYLILPEVGRLVASQIRASGN